MTRQPWIGGRGFDLAFILAPPFVITLLVLALPGFFTSRAVSPLLWAVLVVGVDVGHVYGTLYRTYFDRAEFRRRRRLYVLAPLLGFLVFAGLYSMGGMVFWRALAYLAVFHFVRQQYGFMMLYSRWDRRDKWLDQAAIYAATLYPLVWWHTHERAFSWFMPGDFVAVGTPVLADLALALYATILLAYVGKEGLAWRAGAAFNLPRNLVLGGTALSWWGGIVAMDSDLAFTAVNVIAHGVPYMALIWLFGRNRGRARQAPVLLGVLPWRRLFTLGCLPLFLGLPLLFAYAEEGLWDGLVWAEHPGLFPAFTALPTTDSADLLVWLVPLLALPQITHYLLDAYIWRFGGPGNDWKSIMFPDGPRIG